MYLRYCCAAAVAALGLGGAGFDIGGAGDVDGPALGVLGCPADGANR